MSSVVDASILIAGLIDDGSDGRWAESVIAKGNLAAPELVLAEAGNVLRRLERAKLITGLEARAAYGDLLRLEVELYPFAPFAERIWALRAQVTSYDAWYVAVAEHLDCPFATLDTKLAKSSGPRCAFVIPPRVLP